MVFQSDGQPVGRGPGEAGGSDQAGQGRRARLERGQHQGGLVENADAARVVHMAILPSQSLDGKPMLWQVG